MQSLLYGENLSSFKRDLEGASDLSQFKLWRKKGAIGKIHNIVTYICRSEQRVGVFNDLQQDLSDELKAATMRLKKDTGVRWNSTYVMIKRALRLKGPIDAYCQRWRAPRGSDSYDLIANFLDKEDWEELRHFRELLRPSHELN